MDNLVEMQFFIPRDLHRTAVKPIGNIRVMLDSLWLATTRVNSLGQAHFSLPPVVFSRLESGELRIVPETVVLEVDSNNVPRRSKVRGLTLVAKDRA
jgi:hypothetical protein